MCARGECETTGQPSRGLSQPLRTWDGSSFLPNACSADCTARSDAVLLNRGTTTTAHPRRTKVVYSLPDAMEGDSASMGVPSPSASACALADVTSTKPFGMREVEGSQCSVSAL